MIPNVLTIAGSDCSGGAGIQADIKAISANGGYAMSVVTALTAQNTKGVSGVHLAPTEMIAAQMSAIRDDIEIRAVKIGMLGTAEIIDCVAKGLDGLDCPVVLDPVMVAKGGDRLLALSAVDALRERLLPLVDLITPNLPEAADLLNLPEATDAAGMESQARMLLALGPGAVLLKGGHLGGCESPDLLVTSESQDWLSAQRFATRNTHGTGCTLSATLATLMAKGTSLSEAVRDAKSYITAAIAAADRLSVGTGQGPVHHFHAFEGAKR